jgi:hypothetical protein
MTKEKKSWIIMNGKGLIKYDHALPMNDPSLYYRKIRTGGEI